MAKKAYIGVAETYAVLDYIQSSGTQYIDTGFKANQDTRVIMDCNILKVNGQYADALFGARVSSTSKAFYLFIVGYGTTTETWQSGYNAGSVTGTLTRTGRHKVDMNKNVTTVDGLTLTSTYATFQTENNMLLFNVDQAGTAATDKYAVMQLFSCKVYDNGTLIRDFVPCKNASGVCGLYDKVNGVFYGNKGTGAFTAGTATGETVSRSVARKIKKGYVGVAEAYTVLDCIQSSGTQYIDTGFKPSWNSRVVVDVSNIPTGNAMIFGCRNASSGTAAQQFNVYRSGSTAMRSDYFGTNASLSISDTTGRTVIDKNGNVVTMYGSTVTNTAVSSGTVAYNLFLFAVNNVGTPNSYASYKLYSCQIYDNGTLVRDYVPCKNSSGTVGLYDKANGGFYADAAGGAFTAGTATGETISVSAARKIKKAYIGIGGVARPCWSGGELAYYGTITALSQYRHRLAATSIESHAMFGGGYLGDYNSPYHVATVNTYDKSLTRGTTALTQSRYDLAATNIGNYALFGGGQRGSVVLSDVDAINSSLTKTAATAFGQIRCCLAATSVGGYALFGGGSKYYHEASYTSVDAYNSSLTRTAPTALSTARSHLAATTVGGYALFGGGVNKDKNYDRVEYGIVDAYNSSLTRTTMYETNAMTARSKLAATTVGNYALFGGGQTKDGAVISAVDAYDASLTSTIQTALSVARRNLAATTVEDFALFAGGQKSAADTAVDGTVDCYDGSLTRTTQTSLSQRRYLLGAATVGNYALFGGGYGNNQTEVDAFVVN